MEEQPKIKKPRGLAAVSPERRAEISRMGGLAVPKENRSFFKNRDLASRAGVVGGQNGRPPPKKEVSE
jgi:general stress protein YciG